MANDDFGLYKFRKELLIELLNNGNEIYFAVPNGKSVPELVKLGCIFRKVDIERRSANPFKDLKLIYVYRKLIKEIEPKLVLTYTIKPNIYGGYVSKRLGIPYCANITGLGSAFQKDGLFKHMIINMYKIALKKANMVFFENIANRRVFIDYKIIKEDKSFVLNGAGVNLKEYIFKPLPKDEKVHFLFMGRIMREKGIDELFEVATQLHNEKANCDFTLIGDYEEDYKNKINDLIQNGVVNFCGRQSDVLPYIYSAHAVVLPSYHEGMSNALLESAACGRPLITSDINGCKEAVKNDESGYLCEVKNAESLYLKLVKFIKLTQEERQKMGILARALMEEKFDRQVVVDNTINKLM